MDVILKYRAADITMYMYDFRLVIHMPKYPDKVIWDKTWGFFLDVLSCWNKMHFSR